MLDGQLFAESAREAMHDAASLVAFLPVAENLIALQNGPVVLIPVSLRFKKADALKVDRFFEVVSLSAATEALVNLVLNRARSGRQTLKAGIG